MEITKWKLYNEIEKDDGLNDNNDVKNTLPSHLGAFILGNSKRIMNNYSEEINGFNNIVYTMEIRIACI